MLSKIKTRVYEIPKRFSLRLKKKKDRGNRKQTLGELRQFIEAEKARETLGGALPAQQPWGTQLLGHLYGDFLPRQVFLNL